MKAILTVVRRTTYVATLEMSEGDYDLYEAALRDDPAIAKSASRQLNNKVNPEHWQDDEYISVSLERDESCST